MTNSNPPVISSEVENGAAREAATWTGRPQAERAGSERIKSRCINLSYRHGVPRFRSASLGMRIVHGLALSLLAVTTVHAREAIHEGDVVVVPLHGEVAPSLLAFLRRAVKTAENNKASALVFDLDTYGGRLDTATDMVNVLNQINIPTYTFIDTNAGSAGALIAIGTQHIYMAPVSAIGAAAPILSTGEDLPATAKEKTISYWSALIRSAALKNGHNPDLAEAFMNKDKEVKIGDRVVHPKGAVLTVNSREAAEKINGKPLLAEAIVDSIPDLTKKAGLKRRNCQTRANGVRADRLLDHCARAVAAARRNSRCVFGIQDSGSDLAGRYLWSLLRAFFLRPLSRGARRLGGGRAFRSWSGSRADRDTVLRA